jgi:cytochrome c-type biogenesis protein
MLLSVDSSMGRTALSGVLAAILLLTLFVPVVSTALAEEPVYIEYFHKPKCKTCGGQLNSEGYDAIMVDLNNQYGPQIVVEWIDITEGDGLERLVAYNITLTPAVVFNREHRLVRYEISRESLAEVVDSILEGSDVSEGEELPVITAPLIVVSGLADGVNPCAIALLTFFLSFLFSINRSRRTVIGLGVAYIAGLFMVYLLMGLGILNAISFFGVEHPFGKVGAIFLVVFGALSIRDAFTFEEPVLRFPRFALPRVRSLVEKGALPAAFVLGGVVSMGEFACSGGVYVGILVLLSRGSSFSEGLAYLVLYNLMFILPLVAVLLLGSGTEALVRMDRWRVLKRRGIKLALGAFMIVLGLVTWFYAFT